MRAVSIPSTNTIKFFILQLEETGNTLREDGHIALRTVRTPKSTAGWTSSRAVTKTLSSETLGCFGDVHRSLRRIFENPKNRSQERLHQIPSRAFFSVA